MIEYLMNPSSKVSKAQFELWYHETGRHKIIVINVGNLGELLAGNLENIQQDQELVAVVHQLQRIIATRMETAIRYRQNLIKYQARFNEFNDARSLDHYFEADDDWMYDRSELRDSRELLLILKGLSYAYSTQSYFAAGVVENLEEFAGYLKERENKAQQ